METLTAPAAKFAGYRATLTNHEGQTSGCWVVNARADMAFNDGTRGAGFKVRPAYKYLVQGGHRYAESFGVAIWVKASRVTGGAL